MKPGTEVRVEVEGMSKWKGIILSYAYPSERWGDVWMVEVTEILDGKPKWNPVVGDKLPVWDEYMEVAE